MARPLAFDASFKMFSSFEFPEAHNTKLFVASLPHFGTHATVELSLKLTIELNVTEMQCLVNLPSKIVIGGELLVP